MSDDSESRNSRDSTASDDGTTKRSTRRARRRDDDFEVGDDDETSTDLKSQPRPLWQRIAIWTTVAVVTVGIIIAIIVPISLASQGKINFPSRVTPSASASSSPNPCAASNLVILTLANYTAGASLTPLIAQGAVANVALVPSGQVVVCTFNQHSQVSRGLQYRTVWNVGFFIIGSPQAVEFTAHFTQGQGVFAELGFAVLQVTIGSDNTAIIAPSLSETPSRTPSISTTESLTPTISVTESITASTSETESPTGSRSVSKSKTPTKSTTTTATASITKSKSKTASKSYSVTPMSVSASPIVAKK